MDTRIVALTVAIFSVCVTPMPEAQAQSNDCIPEGPFDPANPASSGFGLVFSDDFTNIAITPDGLVLTPPNDIGGNYNIATAAPANNPQGYVGQAFGGGGYFEAKIKFDPTTINFSQGFPAFFGFPSSTRQIWGPIGTPAGFQHFIEDDFFEFDIHDNNGVPSPIAYGTALHDWYGIFSSGGISRGIACFLRRNE